MKRCVINSEPVSLVEYSTHKKMTGCVVAVLLFFKRSCRLIFRLWKKCVLSYSCIAFLFVGEFFNSKIAFAGGKNGRDRGGE